MNKIRYVTKEYVRARKDSMRTQTCFLPRAWHVGMESDVTESDVQISGCMMSPVHLHVHGLFQDVSEDEINGDIPIMEPLHDTKSDCQIVKRLAW